MVNRLVFMGTPQFAVPTLEKLVRLSDKPFAGMSLRRGGTSLAAPHVKAGLGVYRFYTRSENALVASGYEVVGAYTGPDRPKGRGHRFAYPQESTW